MANQRVSNTALGAAICRLIEQYQPENTRLFHDSMVKDLVGTPIRTLMQFKSMRNLTIQQMDAITPGIYGVQISRTRFIDDAVRDALSQGIEQVVILGAGFDTRPYRLTGIEHTRVFEVDLPSVQEDKKKKLHKHFGRLPEQVTFLPIDFDTQSLEAVFSGTPFDPASPAIFVWEGVTQYLSEEAVHRTLAFVGTSASGSILVFTYVLKSFIERRSDIPGTEKMMDMMAKRGSPWLFGLEPSSVASYLAPFHLRLTADVGSTEHQTRYFKSVRRKLVVSEVERIAQATVVRP
ncbi:S-adenosyl-L-methionine-dependent methyltransferase [Ktedonobacter sp. SOSP1-52]|uniref:class I SAM-dependent methyltransferase n=1 Tax=Ktedonobacter sp. SOSP1-52 TaxID=2778366 RepID=UPI00191608EF|nr:class I SAM-dependent methyltransferase [Ktedonobacter sp. SOSP1-52]GHO70255.1 S-adenosyl-L-methionine-dependent methyltransferase [Ktedonobacter sp. SOSP1-52]